MGGATVVGALLGFLFKDAVRAASNYTIALCAGVMLSAAVSGLILPSLREGGALAAALTSVGIFLGAVCITLLDRAVVSIYSAFERRDLKRERVLLFVSAIAIHNLPEGIAAGVGFGAGNISEALTVAFGIALHNIPEGMVIISPMISAGIKPRRVFLIAAMTGAFEVLGTLIGYFAVSFAGAILPMALAFAGGTMLFVITAEMIPEVCSDGRRASFALLLGFCAMLILTEVLK